jgi:hypothetical protein
MASQSEAQLEAQKHQNKLEELQLEYQLKMQLEQIKTRTQGMAKAEIAMIDGDEKIKQIKEAKKNNLDDTSIGNTVREPKVFSGIDNTEKLD